MNKTLLIIGGGLETIPGVKLAKRMGLRVVISDINPKAPGFEFADAHFIASTYDVVATCHAARMYHKKSGPINGVMCIASDIPYTVASVAEELGLPGIPIESAKLSMDKLAMKNKFRNDGILVPDYKILNNIEDLIRTIDTWGYPLVIKPVDSRGARGVLRLTEKVDLSWAWDCSINNSPTGTVMVEKFLNGPQISTESMMIDGKCYTVGFSDRNYEFIEKYAPYIIENGGDLPSYLSNDVQHAVKELVKNGALSMGVRNGIVKGDIVIHDGQPFIIELAARLSGGYFCTHEIPLNTGVDFLGNAIKMAIGHQVDPNDLVPKFNKNICQRYVFPEPGIIKKINGLSKLKNNSSVKYFDIHAKLGQTIEKPTAHPSRVGMIITSGNSREEARQSAINAINNISFNYF